MIRIALVMMAMALLLGSLGIIGCSRTDANIGEVTTLIQDKIQLEDEADWEGLYKLYSLNYRKACSYEEFTQYQNRELASMLDWLGQGKLYTTDVEVTIIGDIANATYSIMATGEESKGYGIRDIFVKCNDEWYDTAEHPLDPGYNEEDELMVIDNGITPRYEVITPQQNENDNILTMTNPYVELNQVTIYEVDSAPRSEEGHIFLIHNEAVRLPGPRLSSSEGVNIEDIFKLDNPVIKEVPLEGYKVDINSHLMYKILSDDFEEEVSLAQIELIKDDTMISSNFVFVADVQNQGISIDVTIISAIDKAEFGQSLPVSIEVRAQRL